MGKELVPLKDFIRYALKLTTEKGLRCCRVVLPLKKMMELEGNHLPFKDNSKTYENMKMESHRRFYVHLESIRGTEEGLYIEKKQSWLLVE